MTLTEPGLDTDVLSAALLAAAHAVALHLPGAALPGEVRIATTVDPSLIPGTGSMAVTTGLTGVTEGRLVVALSGASALAFERGELGDQEQELAFALEAPVTDALKALEPHLGGALEAEAPLLLDAEHALCGPDLAGGRLVLAVALNDGETHVATVALAAAGPANGPDDTTDAPPERPTPSPAPELPEFATPGASDGTTPTVGVPSFGAANGLAGISSAAAGFEGVPGDPRPLELLHDVEMAVTAELGRARMTVRELLSLTPGAVVELDRAAGSAVDLLVNGKLIARGEVVVVDDEFGVRISEIVGREDAARRR